MQPLEKHAATKLGLLGSEDAPQSPELGLPWHDGLFVTACINRVLSDQLKTAGETSQIAVQRGLNKTQNRLNIVVNGRHRRICIATDEPGNSMNG